MLPFTSSSYYGSFDQTSNCWSSSSSSSTTQNSFLHSILGSSSSSTSMAELFMDNNINNTTTNGISTTTSSRSTAITAAAETKAIAASKSHSEAERRRRERINGHLATLRTLLPNTTKTDKASLLAEVVQHVRELKKKLEADVDVKDDQDQWWPFPRETDELMLGYCEAEEIRVSLSCDDRPDLVSDLTQALRSVRAKVVKAEMATVGGRTKSVLVIRSHGVGGGGGEKNKDELELGKLRKVLKNVIEKSVVSPSTSTSTRSNSSANATSTSTLGMVVPGNNKRPRISHHHHHRRLVTNDF